MSPVREPKRAQTRDAEPRIALDPETLHPRIQEKAYELYLKRGGSHGRDMDDWLEAERIVLREVGEGSGRAAAMARTASAARTAAAARTPSAGRATTQH